MSALTTSVVSAVEASAPQPPAAGGNALAVIVVNYRQTEATLACLHSLLAHAGAPFDLFIVDNAADTASRAVFTAFTDAQHALGQRVTHFSNSANLGFAAGCNQALERILAPAASTSATGNRSTSTSAASIRPASTSATSNRSTTTSAASTQADTLQPGYRAVALLNNDTLVQPGWLAALDAALAPEQGIAMVASALYRLAQPDQVDSLGVVLYRSGIASNRLDPATPLLGPCGGGALYSCELLRAVQALDTTGQVFDPHFFCYAEDTDLALRARALGYRCAFAPAARLLHHGSLASGGAGLNPFIAYHGLRNSLFALIKTLPAGFLVRNLGWILLMQAAVSVKYLVKGHPGLLWRIHRDLALALPRLLRQRRHIQAGARWQGRARWRAGSWRDWTCPRFYDRAYVRHSLRTLHRRALN
jgi:hypothetical protein